MTPITELKLRDDRTDTDPLSGGKNSTLGAYLMAGLAMHVLFGILITQTHAYYRTFGDDKVWLKIFVGGMFILETIQIVLSNAGLYTIAVTEYCNPTVLLYPPKIFPWVILPTFIMRCIIQAFFIYRIWRLTRRRLITLILSALNIASTTLGFVIAIQQIRMSAILYHTGDMYGLLLASFTLTLALDILTTATFIEWLIRQRRECNKSSSTAIICDQLIIWSIQTGFFTSLASLGMLVTFIRMPGNFIWISFYVIVPKLYSNSLLSSLNGRIGLRQSQNEMGEISIAGIYFAGTKDSSQSGIEVALPPENLLEKATSSSGRETPDSTA
ncbi:hypothetical protein BDZ89DRAFT_537908 [Hymenopellis radicata]|nr:hypothetical protein BDZ89DRAFT_537908 [Hymenopellis radicata]